MLDLIQIKARLQTITPGPWEIKLGDLHCIVPEDSNGISDWRFCSHAPEDIAMLLAEVEQLRFQFDQQRECSTELLAEVERLRAELWIARKGK